MDQRRRGLTRRQLVTASAAVVPLVTVARSVAAQAAYPTRPVKVVIPYPPAGGADTVGRILFQKLGEMWGQQFVIDNRGGAGGTIAAAAVAKADRDGYTIMYDATAHSVNPSLYPICPTTPSRTSSRSSSPRSSPICWWSTSRSRRRPSPT